MRLRRAAIWLALGSGCGDGGLADVPSIVERPDAPSLLAEETCRSLFDCDCSPNPYRDRDTCRAVLEQRGIDADMIALAAELEYDGECVSLLATTRRDLGCEAPDDAPACVSCRPFFGTGAAGDACEKLGVTVDVDTCGQGLHCVDRVCVDLCSSIPIVGRGDPCTAGIETLGECEPGSHCDASTQRCAASPVVDEPCPDRICTSDAWCDLAAPDGPTCADRIEAGADCFADDTCESHRCEEGRCTNPTPSTCTLPV